eukprot:Hpha_TRINITY_DN14562_c0_g1::TRINITY_DN14562_c0_g1_i1::g.47286::m.47286
MGASALAVDCASTTIETRTLTTGLVPPPVVPATHVVVLRQALVDAPAREHGLTVVPVVVDGVRDLVDRQVVHTLEQLLRRHHATEVHQLLAELLRRLSRPVPVEEVLALQLVLALVHLVLLQTVAELRPLALETREVVVGLLVTGTDTAHEVEAHQTGVSVLVAEGVHLLQRLLAVLLDSALVRVPDTPVAHKVVAETVVVSVHLLQQLQRHVVRAAVPGGLETDRDVLVERRQGLRKGDLAVPTNVPLHLLDGLALLRAEGLLHSSLEGRDVNTAGDGDGRAVRVVQVLVAERGQVRVRETALEVRAVAQRRVAETATRGLLRRVVGGTVHVVQHLTGQVVLPVLKRLDRRRAGGVHGLLIELGVPDKVTEQINGSRHVVLLHEEAQRLRLPAGARLNVPTDGSEGLLDVRSRTRRRALENGLLQQMRRTVRRLGLETGTAPRREGDRSGARAGHRLGRQLHSVAQRTCLDRRLTGEEVRHELLTGLQHLRPLRHDNTGQRDRHCSCY